MDNVAACADLHIIRYETRFCATGLLQALHTCEQQEGLTISSILWNESRTEVIGKIEASSCILKVGQSRDPYGDGTITETTGINVCQHRKTLHGVE